jgi:hypothetical protein
MRAQPQETLGVAGQRALPIAYSCAVWHIRSKLDSHGDRRLDTSFRYQGKPLPNALRAAVEFAAT